MPLEYGRYDAPPDPRDRRSPPTFPLRRISNASYPASSSYASSSSSSSPTEFRLPTLSPAVFPSQSGASCRRTSSHGRTTTLNGFRVKLEDDEDEDEVSFSDDDGEDEVDELELEMDIPSPSSSRGGRIAAGLRGPGSALPASLPPPPSLSLAPPSWRAPRQATYRVHRYSESSTKSPVESERSRTSESPSSPDTKVFGSRAPPRPKGEGTQFWCTTCGMGFYENGKLKVKYNISSEPIPTNVSFS